MAPFKIPLRIAKIIWLLSYKERKWASTRQGISLLPHQSDHALRQKAKGIFADVYVEP